MPATKITARIFRFARKELKLSVRQLAAKMHTSKSTISRIETAQTFPRMKMINHLVQLCRAAEISVVINNLEDLVRISRLDPTLVAPKPVRKKRKRKISTIYSRFLNREPRPVKKSVNHVVNQSQWIVPKPGNFSRADLARASFQP